MYLARRRAQPKVPNSPAAFAVELLDPANPYNTHFKGVIQVDDEYTFLFASDLILDRLNTIQEAFYDGTFFTTPSMFHQMFSVQGMFGQHCLPILHVLTTTRTEALYVAVLEKLKELQPQFKPTHIMGDYEQASRNAFKTCFPDAEWGGCIFHFSRAIWRKIQKLGLIDCYKTSAEFRLLVKRTMAVPFLPPFHMRVLVNHIFAHDCQVSEPIQRRISQLKTYVTRFWLGKVSAQNLSIYRFQHATNNNCEAFHSRLKSLIRTHRPAIWTYQGHLNTVIKDTELEVRRIDEGLQLTRARKKIFQTTAARRVLNKQKLASGAYSPLHYLDAMAHTLDSSVAWLERGGTNDDRLDLEVNISEEVEEEQQQDNESEMEDDQGGNNQQPLQQQQADQQPPARQCIICLGERSRTVLYLPCRHARVCHSCDQHLRPGTPCPYCRRRIESKIEIYDG